MKLYPQSRILLASFVFHYLLNYCTGADLPFFDTPTNATNVTHRSNFCSLYEDVFNGNVKKRDALRGLNLTIGMFDYQIDNDTGGVDEKGIAVNFLDEIARRAGFEWRNSFGVIESPTASNNHTWDHLLYWSTDVYDLLGDYFVRSAHRLEKNIDYTEPWYDGSPVMVIKKEEVDELAVSTFTAPFSREVWILVFATVLASGIVYYLTDYLESRRRSEKMEASLGTNVFYGFYAFTGHSLFNPRSISTRLVTLSLCFTFLVLSSAYTANLAANFIIDNKPAIVVNSITDAINLGLVICVWETSTAHNYLLKNHKSAKVAAYDSEDKCVEALLKKECDVYLSFANSYEIIKRDARFNGDCSLEWVGRAVVSYQSGFALKDDKELCSKLLTDVLMLHMLEMKEDETFHKIWDNFYQSSATVDCETQNTGQQDKRALTMDQSARLFIFHFAIMTISLVISVIRFCHMPEEKKSSMLVEIKKSIRNPSELKRAASFAHKNQPTGNLILQFDDKDKFNQELQGSNDFNNRSLREMSSEENEGVQTELPNSKVGHFETFCADVSYAKSSEIQSDEKISNMILNMTKKILDEVKDLKKQQ